VAQPGAVWLAGATGQPIVPFHIEANRHWTLSSWDRTQLPKPFGTVAVAFGPPIDVSGTGEPLIEAARVELQQALARLEARTKEMLQRPSVHC
jgi:hypothetical protein